MCEDGAVAATVLILTGTFALAFGLVRGYLSARAALLPVSGQGEPTRTLVEASKPLHARTRVRTSLRHGAQALVWLAVALYGVLLVTVGLEVIR